MKKRLSNFENERARSTTAEDGRNIPQSTSTEVCAIRTETDKRKRTENEDFKSMRKINKGRK